MPNVNQHTAWVIIFLVILLSFVIGAYVYPDMPEQMASHWNAAGVVNGYMPKLLGLFLMPLISIGLALLFAVLPKIDPYRRNVAKFKGYYNGLIVAIMLFLFYLHLLVIFANYGYVFNIVQALAPAFGTLFYYCGVVIGHAKRNWFMGIRTPWTMSSERVWNETHRRGGKLFKLAGVIALAGVLVPDYAIWLLLVPVILSVAYLFVFSYVFYQKKR